MLKVNGNKIAVESYQPTTVEFEELKHIDGKGFTAGRHTITPFVITVSDSASARTLVMSASGETEVEYNGNSITLSGCQITRDGATFEISAESFQINS